MAPWPPASGAPCDMLHTKHTIHTTYKVKGNEIKCLILVFALKLQHETKFKILPIQENPWLFAKLTINESF